MSIPNATQKQREWARQRADTLLRESCPHTPSDPRKRVACIWCLMSALTKAKYGTAVR